MALITEIKCFFGDNMAYPKRREKRKQKTVRRGEAKTLLTVLVLMLINLPLLLSKNFFLLNFSVPITIFIGVLFIRKKQVHLYRVILIFFLLYISYLEISFRLWELN